MPPTGPRTPAGKAASSRNAVRHGLYAGPEVIAGDERPGDWQRFHDAAVASLAPENETERALASRIAALLWCLRRVAPAEAAIVARQAAASAASSAIPAPHLLIPTGGALDAIIRVEARLDRQLVHALHQLRDLQDLRRRNRALLARVDALGAPAARKT